MGRSKQEDRKPIYFNCPESIVDFFENLAKEDLKEEGELVNQMSLSRRRNEMIILLLEQAINKYKEIDDE